MRWYKAYYFEVKYSDTSIPFHNCSKIWTHTIYYPLSCINIAGWVANSVDPDESLHSVASHLALHCLLRPVCPNSYGIYDKWITTYPNYSCFVKQTFERLLPLSGIIQKTTHWWYFSYSPTPSLLDSRLAYQASCLLKRLMKQGAWNIRTYFIEKNTTHISKCHLWSLHA